MEEKYKVIYTGQKNEQFDESNFIEQFAKKYGTAEKAKKLLKITKDTVLKNDVSHEKGLKYQRNMGRLGLIIRLDLIIQLNKTTKNKPLSSQISLEKQSKKNIALTDQAAESSLNSIIESTENAASSFEEDKIVNPYNAPQASLEETFVPKIRLHRVSIGHGYSWVASGFSNAFKTPFTWFFLAFFYCLILGLLSGLPYIGTVLSYIFTSFYMAGIMVGCQDQRFNEPLKIRHLFAGNSHHPQTLYTIGLIYVFSIFMIVMMLALLAIPLLHINTDQIMKMVEQPALMANYINNPMFLVLILIGFGLSIIVYASIWFSPALAALDDKEALESMKLSVRACFKNVLPMFWYSIVLIIVFLLLLVPLFIGFIALVVVMNLNINNFTAFAPKNPVIFIAMGVYSLAALFMFIAISMSSIHAAYRDIFHSDH